MPCLCQPCVSVEGYCRSEKARKGYFSLRPFRYWPDDLCEAMDAMERAERKEWESRGPDFWRRVFPEAFPKPMIRGVNSVDKNDVKAAVRLSELVGQHVTLRMNGNRGTGKCPFHEDRSPSFSVDDEKGTWYCHAEGEGGDCFTYVMKRYEFTFPQSVNFLAELAGLK